MPNRIFRGPVGRNPDTINLPVAGGYEPGVLVVEDGSNLTLATASNIEDELLVLTNVDFVGQGIDTAYTSGDTGVAYRPQTEDVYQVRLAAATYAKGDKLTIGASGYLTAAGTSERVVAFFDGTPGAKSAGALDDVRIANSFLTASA